MNITTLCAARALAAGTSSTFAVDLSGLTGFDEGFALKISTGAAEKVTVTYEASSAAATPCPVDNDLLVEHHGGTRIYPVEIGPYPYIWITVASALGATVTASLVTPSLVGSSPATETTLLQVRDAIKAQIALSSSIWTDNTEAYFVRRDLVNEGTGAITVAWTDAAGAASSGPGTGVRPLSVADRDVLEVIFEATGAGTGYSSGNLLGRVIIIDVNGSTPTVTTIWMNVTTGLSIAAPTGGTYERADERVTTRVSDGTYFLPMMDVAARCGYMRPTDGTNYMAMMDAAARAGFIKVTDGTYTMPTGDAVARAVYHRITDGTNMAAVKAASTPAAATDPALVVAVSPNMAASSSFINSAATTNATAVKATAGTLFSVAASNVGASAAYLKLYNKATAPTVGTDVPVLVIVIPAGGTVPVPLGTFGPRFSTGIALAITGGAADADTTAVAVAQVKVAVSYS